MVFAGGGTGGHVYPALAVAQALARRHPGLEVIFIGTGSPFEKRVVEGHGFRLMKVESGGFLGRGLGAKVSALLRTGMGLVQSLRILWTLKPQAVVGVGGFASGPVVGAAILLRVPTMIQEQNYAPGLANRILSRWVDRIAVAFEETRDLLGGRGEVTGNPIREEFTAVKPKPRGTPFCVLVFGGSQGAHAVNQAMIDALPALAAHRLALRFTHMTGEKDRERVEAAYRAERLDARVVSYLENMAQEYEKADLVVSRAGATTVSELTACQKAAILIPYPHAAADHQRQNAEKLEQSGAARVLPESELSGPRLATEIVTLLQNPDRLTAMERAAAKLARPDATIRVAELVEELMA
ncbi:MAG TPA: undecaprenyldiphospho-muramoylpentapeptide beta-N-acetylglucosaminyltransferase [Candidatus Polarisedimenticolia bacterium]|nr:undecaprenyldiphospho-muramoylpentapeptide beta-N-acetylglucosaminyltransferase [Candidatus Polarisedimenticolia bacterium]